MLGCSINNYRYSFDNMDVVQSQKMLIFRGAVALLLLNIVFCTIFQEDVNGMETQVSLNQQVQVGVFKHHSH